jgi:hypothetical protein
MGKVIAAAAYSGGRRVADIWPMIAAIQASGAISLRGIARELTRRGIPTPRGTGAWQAVQMQRMLDRAG